jgi:hypothetical protein
MRVCPLFPALTCVRATRPEGIQCGQGCKGYDKKKIGFIANVGPDLRPPMKVARKKRKFAFSHFVAGQPQ